MNEKRKMEDKMDNGGRMEGKEKMHGREIFPLKRVLLEGSAGRFCWTECCSVVTSRMTIKNNTGYQSA